MNKIHPEMLETVNEEMRDALKWWKTTTPEEVKARLNKRLLAQQKPLRVKGLMAKRVYECSCLSIYINTHVPRCEQKFHIDFETELPKEEPIYGRVWHTGHSPWGGY